MNNNRWIGIPLGLKDELGVETARRGEIEGRILNALTASGFTQIQTPVLEYYDLFVHAGLPLPQEKMLKMEDRSGRLCVMRPDSTIPAARVAATKLSGDPKPLRLCYNQPVFRIRPDGRMMKYSQAGIEYIGAGGAETDIEVLQLLLRVLRELGLTTLHIEIGHAGLIRALVGASGLGEEEENALMEAFESRNFAVMNDILALCENKTIAHGISQIAMLSGVRDCGQALEIIQHEQARLMLMELKALADALKDEDVSLDGSMVSRMDYYTGLIFRVYTPGVPREIAVGGRYDGLMERFGVSAPAIGFVLDIDALAGREEAYE